MDNNQAHIDQIIKEKFAHFSSVPPEHVWAGIEQGLADQKAPLFIFLYARQFIAAAVLVLIALALWYFIPVRDKMQTNNIEIIDETTQTETGTLISPENIQLLNTEDETDETSSINNETKSDVTPKMLNKQEEVSESVVAENVPDNSSQKSIKIKTGRDAVHMVYLDNKKTTTVQFRDTRNSYSIEENENTVLLINRKNSLPVAPANTENEVRGFKNYWNIGLYFTPEMMVNNIDSVTLKTTYALTIEPSWYFNRHWFMRFGAGISYVRDAGFAKVDYISNDYIGTYDSVVNVTFVEVDDELMPVYHTKEVEIWDSIRHLNIAEITNKYYYIQIPVMFGYHNSTRKFKWYFYGGPAMNIAITEQIPDPQASIEYIEIIDLENNLPQRTDYSLQLWFGAGIDYQIGQKFSLAVEPNYRYYFKPVYQDNNYKTALSGLGVRFGLVYKLGRK